MSLGRVFKLVADPSIGCDFGDKNKYFWHVITKHAVVFNIKVLRQFATLMSTCHRGQHDKHANKILIFYNLEGNVMSVTMHINQTTKDGCFDQFHALAKEELAFTRGSEGCISIHTSSSKDTNTLKFAEVWESEDHFNTYFAKRVERSGEDFARLLEGPPEKECFQTDDWGYGKEWQK